MKSYHVVWEIDVDSDSARGAAFEAWQIMLDRHSTATVFNVTEKKSSVAKRIDLEEPET